MYDGRGSVASLTGSSSSNIVSYTYNAYGEESKSGNTLNNPYRYNAEYTDSSTGYQYLRARYYNPATGRFLTKDTYLGEIEYPLSRNLYAYCYNNPLNYTDPSGHFGILATLAIGAAIGAVVGGATNAIVQKVTTGTVDWKQVGISAAAGALGGLVGGVFGAATGAIIGAVSGGTVSAVTTGAITGVVSGVSGGMASRGVYTALDNRYHGTNNSVVRSMFNPKSMLFDAILGGSLGAIQGGIASGKIKNPFKNSSGTKGEQNTLRAWLNNLKKSCGEKGNAHVDSQTIKKPVEIPLEDIKPKTDFYVTPKGDAIPATKQGLNNNLSKMTSSNGKYVGESSNGPVRVRVENGHTVDPNYTGPPNPDHIVDHIHVEHRANGSTGAWGKGAITKLLCRKVCLDNKGLTHEKFIIKNQLARHKL